MKIKRIILKLFLFKLIFFNAVSDEINFEAKNIELKQNGKILLAYDSNLQLPSKNISIDSKKAEYNKIKNIIYFKDQVFFQEDTSMDQGVFQEGFHKGLFFFRRRKGVATRSKYGTISSQ